MSEFSLENLSEKIHYGKTKDYFREVLSSYHNGNYRSAVVMLWSVAVCDIVYKLQNLIELYGDSVAKTILDNLTSLQERDPKSASWEIELVENTHEKTNLLNSLEYENLRYLQKQRHLSAHPILNSDRELYTPNKETVRALIRNTLEDLLVKPPFYTDKIIHELLEDIAESAPALNTIEKVKRYVESRYLSRVKPEVELSIYRTLWKLVFKLENEDCMKNKVINFLTIKVIENRQRDNIFKEIIGDKDYYSNFSSGQENLDFLLVYLSTNQKIYELLNEAAKIKIQHHAENTNTGKLYGWFLKDSLANYHKDVLSLIEGDNHFIFTDEQLKFLLKIRDTEEWQNQFCLILSSYYCISSSYNQASSRFHQAISPYLELFDKNAIVFLIQRIEKNNQVYNYPGVIENHKEIKKKLFQLLHGENFDLTPYPHFKRNVAE